MGFGQAIAAGWSNWANFQGRARRSEYWFWHLFLWLGLLAIVVVGYVALNSTFTGAAAIAFLVAIWVPTLSLQVRRMHDLGFTGWTILVSLIPYLGAIIL